MFQVDEEISFRMSQAVDSPQKQDSASQMEKVKRVTTVFILSTEYTCQQICS